MSGESNTAASTSNALVVLVSLAVAVAAVGGAAAVGAAPASGTSSDVSASAADSVATRTVSSTSVAPGGSVTVTVVATGSGEGANIEDAFDPEVGSATIQDVTVDGNGVSPLLEQANSNGTLVTLSSVSAGSTIEVTYTLSVPSSATPGSNITISGALTGTQETSIEPTNLTVSTNTPPTADAGSDASVTAGEEVSLDAGGSSDPDGDSLTYDWTQTGGPSVSLSGSATQTPSFTAPSVSSTTTLTFEVTADDGNGGQDTDTVNVTVSPATTGGEGDSGVNRTAPDAVAPGGTATVTLTANATGASLSVTEVFDPSVESATIENVTVNGNSVTPFLSEANENGTVVTLTSTSAGDEVVIEYTLTVPGDAAVGSVYTIEGNVTSDGTQSFGVDRITVEEQSLIDRYDDEGDGIDIQELGAAAADYAQGKLTITELGRVAAAYASN